jgi:hypothetical protein
MASVAKSILLFILCSLHRRNLHLYGPDTKVVIFYAGVHAARNLIREFIAILFRKSGKMFCFRGSGHLRTQIQIFRKNDPVIILPVF